MAGQNLRTLGVFTFSFILLSGVAVFIVWALARWVGYEMGSTAAGIPAMVAALIAGNSYARAAGHRPPDAFSWRMALAFSIIAVALSGFFIALFLPVTDLLGRMGAGFYLLLAGTFTLYVVAMRVFFAIGAKSRVNAMSR